MTFPPITRQEGYLSLAGTLTYEPWVQFPRHILHALSEIIDATREIGGCENPDVLANWRECVRDAQGHITHRSNILLYRDGGDWAECNAHTHWEGIGLLFCREDIEQTGDYRVTYRVHVPTIDVQDMLLDLRDLTDEMKSGHSSTFDALVTYLDSVIDEQEQWIPLAQLLGALHLGESEEEEK